MEAKRITEILETLDTIKTDNTKQEIALSDAKLVLLNYNSIRFSVLIARLIDYKDSYISKSNYYQDYVDCVLQGTINLLQETLDMTDDDKRCLL